MRQQQMNFLAISHIKQHVANRLSQPTLIKPKLGRFLAPPKLSQNQASKFGTRLLLGGHSI